MNMLKRSLAMLLVLAMLFSVVPFSVFADDTVETTASTEAVEAKSGGPGNSDFGHSQGKGKDKDKHKGPQTETEATEVTEETVPETTEETVPETTEETVPETTEETVPETTEETVPETTEETVPETTEETTEATEETTEETTEPVEELQPVVFSLRAGSFMKVFHLDCGRKYFTVDQVKELIDAISNVGFSHMELAIGNDGLRLLLDDMTVTANGKTYNSDTIKSGIKSGNQTYSHSGEWTQAEMDTIIAYAKTKGIEIIPLVNTPGHMDSILAAMKACGIDGYYKSSKRTVDLENAEAVAFTQALVMKYAKYFASKGCSYFNIGADEYANDYHKTEATGMGFGYLIDNNKYGNFITYVNDLVEDIMPLGMTPIAFNDGIYFRENTSFGTFNSNLMVAAWTGGYSGIKPASTTFLANNGHQLLNTNERWYYVLGRKQAVSSTYCYESALSNAKSESVTTVTDHKGNTPIGAMQCVWCDDPSVNYETYKSNVMTLISTLAANNPTYFTGPNVVEPETVTKTDEETGVSASAPGLTDVTVQPVAEEAMTEVKNVIQSTVENAVADQVRAWDITPATAAGDYTGKAEVSVPVPDDWTNVRGGVLESENGETILDIEGKLNTAEDGRKTFTFTMPHFSTGVVYAVTPVAEDNYDVLVKLTVGQTSQTYTDNSGYYTTAEGLNTAVASATLGGTDGTEATVKYVEADVSCNDLISGNNSNWQATDYFYTPDNGANYYPVYATRTAKSGGMFNTVYTFTWGYAGSSPNSDITPIGDPQSVTMSFMSSWPKPSIEVYTKKPGTEAIPAQTTVSFTGVAVGETYATIGSTTYKIVVNKAEISDIVELNTSKTYQDSSLTVTVAEPTIAEATLNNGILTITGKKVGATTVTTDTTVYTITVMEEDLTKVTPLAIEYWITNHPVTPDNQNANVSFVDHNGETQENEQRIWIDIAADADGVHSANGVTLRNLAAATGKDSHMDDNVVVYWKGVVLNTNEYQQTTDANDNESFNGAEFTSVRYWNKTWEVLTASGWTAVAETNQLVAYYLQKTTVTNLDVIQTEVVDWGEVHGVSEYNDQNFVVLDFALQYENGTRNPNSFPVSQKTLKFHCDYRTPANKGALGLTVFQDDDNYYYRRIGTIKATETSNYEVYMITVTPNHDNRATDNNTYTAGSSANRLDNPLSYNGTEKVIWVDDVANLGKFEDKNLQHADFKVGGEPVIEKLDIYNKHAVLVTYYLRAKVTEDALTVHYIDEVAGNVEFYKYNIAVAQGTYFNQNIALPDPWMGNLVNGTIETIDPAVKQTVSSDLSTLPAVAAQYLYSDYECTHIELKNTTITNEDGTTTNVPKDLYLYYTFNPTVTFVADFGLPIEIRPTDLNAALEGIVTDIAATGGSYTAYGQLIDNGTTITYKPTKVMQGGDFFTLLVTTNKGVDILDQTTTQVAFRVYVLPATTVHYEASFLENENGWSAVTTSGKLQNTEVLSKKENNYGYQPGYTGGSASTASVIGNSTDFTFTGTGVDIYANCLNDTGYVSVRIKSADTGKTYLVNTVAVNGDTNATTGQTTINNAPIVSARNLPHGTYNVIITKVLDTKTVQISGFRVYNTLSDSTIFTNDLEDRPEFYELRDLVLTALNIGDSTSQDYGTVAQMSEQVYKQFVAASSDKDSSFAVVLNKEATTAGSANAQDLLDNGPKNELFLRKNETLAFSVTTSRDLQIGLKAPNGATKYKINNGSEGNIATSVDMFYDMNSTPGSSQTYNFTITNTGDNILSVTLLKVCDDPSFAFQPLTVDSIETALVHMGYSDNVPETPVIPSEPTKPVEPQEPTKPVEPQEPTKPGKPEKPEKPEKPGKPEQDKPGQNKPGQNKPGKPAEKQKDAKLKITYINMFGKKVGSATLTKTGTANQRCIFSVSEITKNAPARRHAVWFLPVITTYGSNTSIIVPVI